MKTGGHNICFSGGAVGADMAWGEAADAQDHRVVHYSFNGHKSGANFRYILTETQLKIGDAALDYANQTLQRRFPSRDAYINSLLRRNFHIVHHAQTVYAVAPIIQGKVDGGTAWGVQMAIDANKLVYVFDLETNRWYHWIRMVGRSWWEPIGRPPFPMGLYAGIGSLEITEAGLEAIKNAYAGL